MKFGIFATLQIKHQVNKIYPLVFDEPVDLIKNMGNLLHLVDDAGQFWAAITVIFIFTGNFPIITK